MKTKKRFSVEQAYAQGLIVFIVFDALFLITDIVLFSLYFSGVQKDSLLIAVYVVSLVFVVALSLIAYYVVRHNRTKLYKELYETTEKNYQAILEQRTDFVPYDTSTFSSFEKLNETVAKIEENAKNSVVYNGEINYDEINLTVLNQTYNIVSYVSFKKCLKNIILKSLAFRNAVISFTFQTAGKAISEDEKVLFAENIESVLSYKSVLVIDRSENNEMLVYVPSFDTIDRLKEEIFECLNKNVIIRYGQDGHTLLSPKVAVVVYPYSDMEDIFSDLEYAKRQNEIINIYLPNKFKNKNVDCLQTNINTNFISHVFEKMVEIDTNNFDNKENQNKFTNIVSIIANYYAFDHIFMFSKNDLQGVFEQFYSYKNKNSIKDINPQTLNYEFVEELIKHLDPDSSYFFSCRKHLSPALGRFLDIYDLSSAFFYVIKEGDNVQGLIVYGKFDDLFIDSYLREGLLVFSRAMANIVYFADNRKNIEDANFRLSNILKITDLKSYTVDKDTYNLISVSDTLKKIIPDIKEGLPCYKAIYKHNKPCAGCPLTTGKKMHELIGGSNFESSLALSIPRRKEKTILLTPMGNEDFAVRERYDRDLLINTYFSFIERMRDDFVTLMRGYVIIANIDNQLTLQNKLNSESYNEYLRSFFNGILKSIPDIEDIYFIPNHSFAFILPNSHRRTIFNVIEKINALSKQSYLENNDELSLTMTYFVHTYPFGYQNSDEYVRYVTALPKSYLKEANKDLIILPETKYIRSASHKVFVNDILDNSLDKNTFSVKLQPMVRKSDRHIESTEMLLRVSESYLGNEMNTMEIINAAAENNKISLITNILIEHIGALYKEYENSLFKRYGIKSLSLNTDYSFFKDLNFIDRVKELEEKNNLPQNFLAFEIQESEIAHHMEEFEAITSAITKNNITMVCDNYSGKYIPLAKIKAIGFKGIKIDRSVVNTLINDASALEGVKNFIDEADKIGLSVTLVGIEAKEQYDLLKEDLHQFNMQGYYFYRPMDPNEIINVLIKSDTK